MIEKKENQDEIKEESSSFIFGLFVNYLKPSTYIDSIQDISLTKLKEQGIKMIICDLDNTLVPHYTKFPTRNAINFVKEAKKLGIKFVLISNNTKKRVRFFSEKLNIDEYIFNAQKPLSRKIRKFLKNYNYTNDEILMIGDMIVTDILVANILHIESILVAPIIDYEKSTNKLFLFFEKYTFTRLSRNNLITSDNVLNKIEFYEEYDLL